MATTQGQLSRFPGGLRLASLGGEALEAELGTVPLPAQIILPLHQHIGAAARTLVKVGERVLRGQCIGAADGLVSASVHASTSGTVAAIEQRPVPHPSGLAAPCVVIDVDGKDESVQPLTAITTSRGIEPAEIRNRAYDAGLVGLGGAAFPSSVKLTARVDKQLTTLILNGAECDPSIHCDEMLMRTRAARVVEGAQIMLHALQINECRIAVESNKPEAVEAIRTAVQDADDERLALVEVPAVYPEGGERQLIQVLSGQEVPWDGLPLDIGYTCHNVGTAVALADAVLDGLPLTSRIVTVTGPGVHTPRNLEVRIGTPVSHLIEYCGGYTESPHRVVMGGVMMGFALATDAVPIVKASNCIYVFTAAALRPVGDEMPCIRCGECARVCPASLLPQQLYWHSRAAEFDRCEETHLFDCIECGCCDYVCPSHIPLVQYFRYAKGEVRAKEHERQKRDIARERFEYRTARLDRERAERSSRKRRKAQKQAGEAAEDERARVIREAVARERARRPDNPPG